MLAAMVEDSEDHQVRVREQPLFGLLACGSSRALDEAEVLAARKISQMLEANPGQAGDFFLGEDLLAGFHCNHFQSTTGPSCIALQLFDAADILFAAKIPSNSASVPSD